jgi:hypothetical protein
VKLDDKLGNFGRNDTAGVQLRKKESLRNNNWLNITDCPNHLVSEYNTTMENKKINFQFSVFPLGYENEDYFSVHTLRPNSKKWELGKEWKKGEFNMSDWQQFDSEVYFPANRMKFRIRSLGSNESKMISLDDLSIICD